MCDCEIWVTVTHVWHSTDLAVFVTQSAYVCDDPSTCMTWLIFACDMAQILAVLLPKTRMCDMTHPHEWHDSSKCVTWLIHMNDMTHPNVWHDSSTCVTWLIHMYDMTHLPVWHGTDLAASLLKTRMCDMTHSCICVIWLTHMYDMTHPHVQNDSSYIYHDSCMCVMWLTHMYDMTHPHMRDDSCTCVPWLMHMCDMTRAVRWIEYYPHMYDMTHPHVCHDSSTCARWLTHMCAMTHPHVWHGTDLAAFAWYCARIVLLCTHDTHCSSMGVCLQGTRCLNAGWRRLVSSMKSMKLIDGKQLLITRITGRKWMERIDAGNTH